MEKSTQTASALLLCTAFFGATSANAAVSSTFDTNSEGWTVVEYSNPGVFTGTTLDADPFSGGFGNPAGSILATDPGDDFASRFSAPAAYLGDLSAYLGGTLTFDLRIVLNPGPTALPVVPSIVEFIGGDFDPGAGVAPAALGYTGALPTTAWAPTYTVSLAANGIAATFPIPPPVGSWIKYDPTTGPTAGFVQANPDDFTNVFANVVRLTINGEVTDATDDTLGLDNVTLNPVPVPAALPLLLSALFGLGFAARRRG